MFLFFPDNCRLYFYKFALISISKNGTISQKIEEPKQIFER